jgi:AraC-like DNA-binding protein
LIRSIRFGTGSRAETTQECLLPSGQTDLYVILNRDEFRSSRRRTSGAFVYGPDDRASVIEIESGRAHVSVEFTPAGAAAFFPAALSDLRGDAVDLHAIWGRDGAQLRERVLDAPDKTRVVEDALLQHLTGGPDPAIRCAVDWLETGASLASVTAGLGLLPRTFRRRFVAQVGITPKRYARVRRLQRVVHSIDGCTEPDWAVVAAQHGYCDQAHLIDEFRDLIGLTPGKYVSRRIDGPNHLRIETSSVPIPGLA